MTRTATSARDSIINSSTYMNSPLKITLLGLLLTTTFAHAHAFLDTSEPAVGCTCAASPQQVKIWFTEKLHHDGSTIAVFDTAGNEVDRHDAKVSDKNELQMAVSLPKLPPGKYKVEWHAIAIDTHHTQGTFTFVVAQ